MGLICRLFGHRAPEFDYVDKTLGTVDGVGLQHVNLSAICWRCGESFPVGATSYPDPTALRARYLAAADELQAARLELRNKDAALSAVGAQVATLQEMLHSKGVADD